MDKMNLQSEQTHIVEENKDTLQINTKRKCEDASQAPNKRIAVEKPLATSNENEPKEQNITTDESQVSVENNFINKNSKAAVDLDNEGLPQNPNSKDVVDKTLSPVKGVTKSPEKKQKPTTPAVPQSPKKRLELEVTTKLGNKNKEKFIYGNYSQYYGYRNKDQDFHDIRLDVFEEHKELFTNKQVLDIGCNTGFITMEVARKFEVKSMVGLDIDKHLINQAIKSIIRHKKSLPMNNEFKRLHKFPFNVSFVQGNYVLKDRVLLEIERPQFDVLLCLSITKWIHLNFGDDGLKLAFKRMFLQLHPKGILILEAQPFDNYGRRKKITDTIFTNYKNIKFLPKDFDKFLLSSEVGFSKMDLMGVPDHCKKGFKRPIKIFFKE